MSAKDRPMSAPPSEDYDRGFERIWGTEKTMIVKVQIAIGGHGAGTECLTYNEDKSIFVQEHASEEMLGMMGGQPKKFFHVKIKKGTRLLEITGEAPWQDW